MSYSRHAGSKDQSSKLDGDEERKPSCSRRLEHRAIDRGEDYESDDDNDDDDDDDDDNDDESNDDDDETTMMMMMIMIAMVMMTMMMRVKLQKTKVRTRQHVSLTRCAYEGQKNL